MSPVTRTRAAIYAGFSAFWLVMTPVARADCPAPVAPAATSERARGALAALAAGDRDAYQQARFGVLGDLRCLSAPLDPLGAAALHRMEAVDAFRNHDPALALSFFRAARQLDPLYVLPEELGGEGSPMRRLWEEASAPVEGATRPYETPPQLHATVDGRPAVALPLERPYLLLIFDDYRPGRPVFAAMVRVGEAAPPMMALVVYPTPPATGPTGPGPADLEDHPHAGRWFALGAGVTALGAGGLWTAALLTRGAVETQGSAIADGSAEFSASDYTDRMNRTNGLGYAAQASTGLALGLGVFAVTLKW